jgi:hypothetical protein
MRLKESIVTPKMIFKETGRVTLVIASLWGSAMIMYLLLAMTDEASISKHFSGSFQTVIAAFLLFLCGFAWGIILSKFIIKHRNLPESEPNITKIKTTVNHGIIEAPGTKLLALVDFLFRPATVELTFKPLISDWRAEHCEAWYQGRTKKARWIMIRYRFIFACTFIKAMGLSKVFSLFKQLSK